MSTFAREGTALITFLKSGGGLPLQKFDKVQLAFLAKLLPGEARSRMLEIGFTAPAQITISLTLALSPAIFPRPQIAYSTTSMCEEFNNSTKTLTVPFSSST